MSEKIVLALGGGGVKGIAHLGVVDCLLKHNYDITGIAGTSAGGMFGATLAAKVPPREILEVVTEFMKSPSFRRSPSDSASLLGTAGIENTLRKFNERKIIETLPIKFCVTAVSLKTGKEVIIDEGDVMDAVLATIAIPGVFPTRGEEVLVDGGVLDPVPIESARALNPSVPVVAVTLHTKPEGFSPEEIGDSMSDQIPPIILDRLSRNRIAESLKNMNAGVELGSDRLTELNIEVSKPDVVVRPIVGHYSPLQIVEPTVLFEEGYRAMESQLSELEDALTFVKSVIRITKYSTSKKG